MSELTPTTVEDTAELAKRIDQELEASKDNLAALRAAGRKNDDPELQEAEERYSWAMDRLLSEHPDHKDRDETYKHELRQEDQEAIKDQAESLKAPTAAERAKRAGLSYKEYLKQGGERAWAVEESYEAEVRMPARLEKRLNDARENLAQLGVASVAEVDDATYRAANQEYRRSLMDVVRKHPQLKGISAEDLKAVFELERSALDTRRVELYTEKLDREEAEAALRAEAVEQAMNVLEQQRDLIARNQAAAEIDPDDALARSVAEVAYKQYRKVLNELVKIHPELSELTDYKKRQIKKYELARLEQTKQYYLDNPTEEQAAFVKAKIDKQLEEFNPAISEYFVEPGDKQSKREQLAKWLKGELHNSKEELKRVGRAIKAGWKKLDAKLEGVADFAERNKKRLLAGIGVVAVAAMSMPAAMTIANRLPEREAPGITSTEILDGLRERGVAEETITRALSENKDLVPGLIEQYEQEGDKALDTAAWYINSANS